MDITSVTTTTATTAAAASGSASETTSTAFATALEEASAASTDTTTETDATASTTSSAEGKADVVSGRLGIDYKALGVPYRVVYFDENGEQLTTSPFNAARILELTEKFGIDLNDLTGLGEQLDAAGVGYRPYELYPGTGSDHGIDFADLIDNGLGTAYDWREDANVALKGDSGQKSLTAAQELAEELGVERHDDVTIDGGGNVLTTDAAATTDGDSAATTDVAASEEAGVAQTTTAETDGETSAAAATEEKADIVSGRLGIDYKDLGVPYRVVYFDENGEQLTTSPFNAARILELTEKFGIDLNDLTGLGEQLDAAGVGYRPYELYPGTGSDHGIDFADLIDNGLGTAYDWREDANVALKGDSGQKSLTAAQELAERLGVERHATVTTGGGIDSSQFAVQSADGSPLSAVAFNGSVAAWYATHDEAAQAAAGFGGQVLDLADTTTATSANTATTASTNITV